MSLRSHFQKHMGILQHWAKEDVIWKKKKALTSLDPHCLFQAELEKGRPSWPHCVLLLTILAYPQSDALILQNRENSSSLTSLLKTLSWLRSCLEAKVEGPWLNKQGLLCSASSYSYSDTPLHTQGTHASSLTESSKPFHDYMSMILIYVSINVPNMLYCT